MSEAISKAVNPVTEQDREKKIAEIREAAKKPYWNVFDDARSIANAPEWLRFLLSELEEITEQIDELLDEKAEWQVVADQGWHVAGEETKKNESLCDQLQSAQQEIERLGNLARQERELANHWMRKHHDDVVKLREEREKLIEGLREIDTHIRSTPEPVQHIVETLKRVLPEYQEGVTVE